MQTERNITEKGIFHLFYVGSRYVTTLIGAYYSGLENWTEGHR